MDDILKAAIEYRDSVKLKEVKANKPEAEIAH
jgi:hypothetical protein